MKPPENCKPLDGLKNCIIGIFAAHGKGPVQKKCADISHSISACWAALSKIEDVDIRAEIEREIAASVFKAIDLGSAVDWKHHRVNRTKVSREIRQASNTPRCAAVMDAILAVAGARGIDIVDSDEFANRIQPGVHKHLVDKNLIPTAAKQGKAGAVAWSTPSIIRRRACEYRKSQDTRVLR